MNKDQVGPFLRWAGSKKKLLPELSQYCKDYNRYIEPFAGSARLFFHISPPVAILGDLNTELVNCYNVIKINPFKVSYQLSNFAKDSESYYQIRSQKTENLDLVTRAARFIYLNRYCFNGLYRTNSQGEFNVPFGGLKTGNLPSEIEIVKISSLLQGVDIINSDFEALIVNNTMSGDFVYLDPPYTVKNKRIFKQYGPTNFGVNDVDRLFSLLDFIDNKGAKFLLSYAYCDELRTRISKWNSKVVTTQRNIAGFASQRKKEQEYLISNS